MAAFAQCPDEQVLPLIDAFLAASSRVSLNLVEAAVSAIEAHGLLFAPALAPFLAEDSLWRRSATGVHVVARLLEMRKESGAAILAWTELLNQAPFHDHAAWLCRARLRCQTGDLAGAFTDLRQAVIGVNEYGFLARAARLLTRLRRSAAPPAVRRTRIALLSSSTADFLAPLLQLACFRDGIDAEIYIAPYGNFRQDVIDPSSGLYAFRPDFVIIATHWRDAHLPALAEAPEHAIEAVVEEFSDLWQRLLQRQPCRIIQHGFDLPALDSAGHLGRALPNGRSSMLREINRRLLNSAPNAVAILDLDHVAALYGRRAWSDAPNWHLARQYPAARALPLLVDHETALIRAGLGMARKVLVLDLDNTLWGGVVGEDGVEGICLGPPSPAGEAYQALQRYAKELQERGVLLAVCSKNNAEDARLPFNRHDAMILRLDDFVAFQANWLEKPGNLREIARKLNLGIDSLVFLDDNPVERARVRCDLPEVAVPEVGPDPSTFVDALEDGLYFEAWTLSEEDQRRHQDYRSNALRDELQASAGSLEDFLRSLHMEAEAGPFDETVLARIVQLLGKTNQFNLTTRRYSEAQVRSMTASPDFWTQYFKLRDRFGDSGLIGVMIARRATELHATWEIDAWLMSCRVIGRGMEELMLGVLIGAAYKRGISTLRGLYLPTRKNAMVADLYTRFGFIRSGDLADGGTAYELELTAQPPALCTYVRLIE
jgi:FkbH-like protein